MVAAGTGTEEGKQRCTRKVWAGTDMFIILMWVTVLPVNTYIKTHQIVQFILYQLPLCKGIIIIINNPSTEENGLERSPEKRDEIDFLANEEPGC